MNTVEDKKCTSCHHNWPMTDYVGLKGQECKVCKTCRAKVAARDKTSEAKARKRELQRPKSAMYSKRVREKKKLEDPEKYAEENRRRRAEWRQKWNEKNPEWRKNSKCNYQSAQAYLKSFKYSATRRNIEMTLDDESILKLMNLECFYCKTKDEKRLNSIDRLYNNSGYCKDNCVTSCKTCNMTKICLDPQTFVDRCKQIATNHFPSKFPSVYSSESAWPEMCNAPKYDYYKYRAKKLNLVFDLTVNDFEILTKNPCFYCRRSSILGIGLDRINSSLGYAASNIVTCCSECKYMKGSFPIDVFLNCCLKVTQNCNLSNIQGGPKIVKCISKRNSI